MITRAGFRTLIARQAPSQVVRRVHRCPNITGSYGFPNRSRPKVLLSQILSKRSAATLSQNARDLFRKNPVSVSLAVAMICFGVFALGYTNYVYQSYIVGAFHNYPEPVAQKLRRALYFTNYDLKPKEAIKYYKQALQVAEEVGMDPFSDEIMGIKIQVASLMERLEQYRKAIQVLEIIRNDNLEWIKLFGEKRGQAEKRTRILAKTIAITNKLGQLYANPAVYDLSMAESRLAWSVETALRERSRRDAGDVLDRDEGPWLSNDELGAAMETLAHHYETSDLHYLAAPLFLQALALHEDDPCHKVVLMNNLASCLAQQSPTAANAVQQVIRGKDETTSRENLVQHARSWAQKALDTAANINPPTRTQECDVGCSVALHNLGEFAEIVHDYNEARKRYQEAISLADAIGFDDGRLNSSAALKRLPDYSGK